jgi:hypothetical protein
MKDELVQIAKECREAADIYFERPGLAGHGVNAGTIADLYGTIARLAAVIAAKSEPTT